MGSHGNRPPAASALSHQPLREPRHQCRLRRAMSRKDKKMETFAKQAFRLGSLRGFRHFQVHNAACSVSCSHAAQMRSRTC